MAVFSEISDELAKNGFEVEPFGARSVAVKTAPAGIEAPAVEHMLHELLDQFSREEQALNLEEILEKIRTASPPPSPAMPPSRSTCRSSKTK